MVTSDKRMGGNLQKMHDTQKSRKAIRKTKKLVYYLHKNKKATCALGIKTQWHRKLKHWLCINLEGWDGEGDGREVQEEGNIYIPMADSC